ncbi:hypothetical protein E4T47_00621 [Aureobasidium subglaciale]|nr:hypothetical protein E4T47_00621 [Aureobasidium subglaciale]
MQLQCIPRACTLTARLWLRKLSRRFDELPSPTHAVGQLVTIAYLLSFIQPVTCPGATVASAVERSIQDTLATSFAACRPLSATCITPFACTQGTITHRHRPSPISAAMVQVTIQINAPGHALDEEFLPLDADISSTLADLKKQVHDGTGFPISSIQFFLNGAPVVGDTKTLDQAGIKNGEMLYMLVRDQNNMPRQQARPQPSQPPQSARLSNDQIETLRLQLLGNPQAMQQVSQERPELAAAASDPVRFRELYLDSIQQSESRERERREQMQLLNDDPFNIEAQQKIEEIIRQDRVMENLEYAYEHNPEVFGRVTMLYINCEVNGHKLKAFVDSGAQTTIMSPSCADNCGIMRLIDKRYSGIARGVGTAQILGRVHSADIKIGNAVMPCSFTVMEGKDVDLLLGLDMLKRYQGCIDLRRNKLVFEGNEVDFLPESELPRSFEEALQNEEHIKGPNGTEIGTKTGTVTQAGPSSQQTNDNFQGQGRSVGGPSVSGPAVHPTPAASAPARAAAPTQASPASKHPEPDIEQLIGLGFSRQEAIAALDATDGNVEYAAGLLFQG